MFLRWGHLKNRVVITVALNIDWATYGNPPISTFLLIFYRFVDDVEIWTRTNGAEMPTQQVKSCLENGAKQSGVTMHTLCWD